jgi:GNAT superfamily N-acetyltransferase
MAVPDASRAGSIDVVAARMTAQVRPATVDDLPAMANILSITDEPVDWPGVPGWPYLEHLLRRANVFVAADRDGRVIGLGGAIDVGRRDGPRVRWVTDLFILPDRQQRGAGSALLDELLGGIDQRMTGSSSDPRALALYIRAGMRPWWPMLYVALDTGLLANDAGVEVEAASVEETAAWAEQWTGRDRRADFAYFESLPGAAGFVVRDANAIAAVGWSRMDREETGRWMEHVSIAPDADPVRATVAALRSGPPGGLRIGAVIPGPHPAVATLLEHGMRILEKDTFCATEPTLLDPSRILPNAGVL